MHSGQKQNPNMGLNRSFICISRRLASTGAVASLRDRRAKRGLRHTHARSILIRRRPMR